MHQSSLIAATVACFVAALTVAVEAEPVIKHKYADTAAFKPYFCNAFHTGCRRYCSYEFQYGNSTCKASKNKKYFTVDCNCKGIDPGYDFTTGTLKHTKSTAQRPYVGSISWDADNLGGITSALDGDCKAVCKGAKKVTSQFTVLPPKGPYDYDVNYSYTCKCDEQYVNDLVDYWVRVNWDI